MPEPTKRIWPKHAALHGVGRSADDQPCDIDDCSMALASPPVSCSCIAYLPGVGKTGKNFPESKADDLIARGFAADRPIPAQ